jgi:putative transposase
MKAKEVLNTLRIMQLVEKHIVKGGKYHDLCVKAKNLYNQSLYYWRQSIFGKIEYFNEYELTGLFAEFKEENYIALPAQTSQQTIKLLFKNVKSWQKARKEYVKNPSKFLGKPKLPNYKKETSIAIFTSQQAKIKNGFIHFPAIVNLPPIKTKVDNVCQVRIIPNSDHFTIEVVYEQQEKPMQAYNSNWMGIDLGLNNLATCATKEGAVIINGRPLKAINHYYNKRKKKLQSLLPNNQFTTKRIQRLTNKRNRKIDDYIHKASRKIIEIAKAQDITVIVIGNNKNWKQEITLGEKTNRQFTAIPHSTLITKTKYKGLMEGIEIQETQEAYTSKCSAIDLEPIRKHETYAGKRKKRGLFVTKEGRLINADHNGGLNIARLGLSVTGNEIPISELVMSAALAPKKISVLTHKMVSK